MHRWQQPNPLDRVFLALDEAWRHCGLPGVDIHLHLELDGRVDVEGLGLALRGLHRMYPATAARLVLGGPFAAAGWRLAAANESRAGQALRVVNQPDASRTTIALPGAAQVGDRLDWRHTPPYQITVIRCADDDHVIVRWPHALMDARGGATLVEEMAGLYDELAPLPPGERDARVTALASRGDETRRDFGALTRTHAEAPTPAMNRTARDVGRCPPGWTPLRICEPRRAGVPEAIGLSVRHLSPRDAEQVRAAAWQTCGLGGVAEYVRACAVRAFHEVVGGAGPGACYSTLHLIDNRRRRDPGPVCHNVFSSLPVFVPAEIAADVRAVGERMQAAARGAIETGWMHRRLAHLRRLARVPTWLLARLLQRSLLSPRARLPTGLANAPSLPLGFMGDFSRPLRRFCGASVRNVLGIRPPAVHSGIGVNVNAAVGRMNVAVTYFEPRVSTATVERFLDACVASMLATPRA